MSVYAIGVDAVDISRIADMIERHGDRFVRRVFTETEIAYCQPKVTAAASFAARFATKEAVFKATGIGLDLGMHWRDVEVVNDERGRPFVVLYGETAQRLSGKTVHLSLTHTDHQAIAMVVVDEDAKNDNSGEF